MAASPNILFILADQHRADVMGCAGHPDVTTPHIDRIAKAGVRYENCFCCFPVCTPSRYALLSGRYVHETRCWDNHCTLMPWIPTWPRTLRDFGYSTAAVGKMHFTPTYQDVGFERLQLCEQHGPGRWDDDYHRMLMARGEVDVNDLVDQVSEFRKIAPAMYWKSRGAQASNLPEALHSTTWIGDRAMEELAGWSKDRPSLLMVGFVKPHHPMDPPQPWDKMYDPAKLTLPADYLPQAPTEDVAESPGFFPHADLEETTLRQSLAFYYATLSHLDREIGRMLDHLEQRGLLTNTLVVYAADHGDYCGSHHLMLKGGAMYDALARVPLIIRYPDGLRAGTVHRDQVSLVDLAATVCTQAGTEFDHGKDEGLDLSLPNAGRDVVFAEAGGRWPDLGRVTMARTRGSKLLAVADNPQASRFFDLKADPQEQVNRFNDPSSQEEIARLTKATHAWRGRDWKQPSTLDEEAPTIREPNAPTSAVDRATKRAKLQEFVWERMQQLGFDAPKP